MSIACTSKGTLVAYLAAGLVLDCLGLAAPATPNRPSRRRRLRQSLPPAMRWRQRAQKRALWTTAQDALKQAEDALARQDYASAERLARLAAEQARLGIEQLGYPHFQ